MRHFNLFTAFCLMAISGVFTAINAVRSVVAAGFSAVITVVNAKIAAAIAVLLLTSAFSGCAAWRYPGEEYGNVESISFEHEGETWKIFDKPEKNRLLISHAWYGISGHYTYRFFHDAVRAYLDSKNSGCKVEINSEVSTGFTHKYEVEYTCSK